MLAVGLCEEKTPPTSLIKRPFTYVLPISCSGRKTKARSLWRERKEKIPLCPISVANYVHPKILGDSIDIRLNFSDEDFISE